jgi:PhzF family phenazine biosynthesis protein
MQAIAAEMALSETAFLLRTNHERWVSGTEFSLRWFTPKVEVSLCGHATLASAAVLFDVVGIAGPRVTFRTRSGELVATKKDAAIALDFPLDPPVSCEPPVEAYRSLGLTRDQVIAAAYGERTRKLLLHIGPQELRGLTPDFAALLSATALSAYRGLIVTADGAPDYDFLSRYFAPWVGIDEDPVTGSSHTLLTPYWAGCLGRSTLRAYQASSRGGELRVSLLPSGRVELAGQALLVFEGYLSLPEVAKGERACLI